MDIKRLKEQLRIDEGVRHFVYKDSVGIETIGVGRNLRDVGLSNTEIDLMLSNDVNRVITELDINFPWWVTMHANAREALVNMCFNLGITRLRGFKNMLGYLRVKNYSMAADEALDSKWARQVGERAKRIAAQFQNEGE